MNATSNDTRKLNILVVDDEHLIADSLVRILHGHGFNATARYNGTEAINQAATAPFDVLITDVVMDGMTGIDAAIEVCKVLPNCKVLLLSGNMRTGELLKGARERGYDFDIFAKPVHPSQIIEWLTAISVLNRGSRYAT